MDTLARLGGDDFGILLPDVRDGRCSVKKMTEKIQLTSINPHYYSVAELYPGVSIGITVYPEHGADIATLKSRSDVAMYRTKNTEAQ